MLIYNSSPISVSSTAGVKKKAKKNVKSGYKSKVNHKKAVIPKRGAKGAALKKPKASAQKKRKVEKKVSKKNQTFLEGLGLKVKPSVSEK